MNQTQQSAAVLRNILLDLHEETLRAQKVLFSLDLSDDLTGKADCLRRTFIRKAGVDAVTLMNLAHLADMLAEADDEPEGLTW